MLEPRLLERVTTEALKHGWQVCTHAIGDKANAQVLDAYTAARKAVPSVNDARLRIEHAQLVRKQDVGRFKVLDVIASMQPSHAVDDMRWADARVGTERGAGGYAWRWFEDDGVRLAFGSDAPVSIISPFYGLACAVSRQDEAHKPGGGWHPEQRLTLEQALRAFTAGAAYAEFAEARIGMLRVGMRADLTIVDRDLFKASSKEIRETKVEATVVDGEILGGAAARSR